ncbi:hypothetical protein D3C78_1942500 [compost metagenome]
MNAPGRQLLVHGDAVHFRHLYVGDQTGRDDRAIGEKKLVRPRVSANRVTTGSQ